MPLDVRQRLLIDPKKDLQSDQAGSHAEQERPQPTLVAVKFLCGYGKGRAADGYDSLPLGYLQKVCPLHRVNDSKLHWSFLVSGLLKPLHQPGTILRIPMQDREIVALSVHLKENPFPICGMNILNIRHDSDFGVRISTGARLEMEKSSPNQSNDTQPLQRLNQNGFRFSPFFPIHFPRTILLHFIQLPNRQGLGGI